MGNRPYQDEEWLRERWFSDMSMSEIADEANCHVDTITRWARNHGLPHRKLTNPWNDEETLRRLYHGERMSQREIADELGTSEATVYDNMKRLGIEARSLTEAHAVYRPHAHFRTGSGGYERVEAEHGDGHSSALVHQLVAIANGADPHGLFGGGLAVHHRNGVPWDNRPSNLKVMKQDEHGRMHAQNQNEPPDDTGINA
jgi:predicted DNA-binding protein YlxM (UPF0122 family)